jgi:hypothetical protein
MWFMITLETINLFLDIVVKLFFLLMIGFGFMVLKKLDKVMQKAEKSAESIEHTAETVERLVGIADFLPFIGPKRKKIEEEFEDEVEEEDE